MKEVSADFYVSKNLPNSVVFIDLYHSEIKEIIDQCTKRHGASFTDCVNTECLCKISIIYPEIMISNDNLTKFVCPFCYTETASNNDWGYSIDVNCDNDDLPYGYKFTVYFKNIEDACVFYMYHSDRYGDFIKLNLND